MKTVFITLFALASTALHAASESESTYAVRAAEANGLAQVEKAAIESPAFLKARQELKKSLAQASFVSRTVVPYGGMRTYDPSTSYLVIERWYGFDTYGNIIAEVNSSSLPPNAGFRVRVKKLVDAE